MGFIKSDVKGNKVGGFISNKKFETFWNKIDSWNSKMTITE